MPDKPSIALLPLVKMSEDPKQEYFSDGITMKIITALEVKLTEGEQALVTGSGTNNLEKAMRRCRAQGGIGLGKKFSSARKLAYTARRTRIRIGPAAI